MTWVEKLTAEKGFEMRGQALLELVGELYSSQKIILFYRGSRKQKYSLVAHTGIERACLSIISFRQQPFIFREGQSDIGRVNLKQWKSLSEYLKIELDKVGIDSVIPFWIGDECVGGVVFDNNSCEERADFEVLSSEFAYLMEIAYLESGLKRQSWEKKVLLEAGKSLSTKIDIHLLLDHFIDSIKEIIQYDAASIFLVNGNDLRYTSYRGYSDSFKEIAKLKVDSGIAGAAIKQMQAITVPDVSKDDRFIRARATVQSVMSVPIVYNDEAIGVIVLESDELSYFRYYHIEIVQAFAAQAAIVINSSRLLRDAVKVRELEKELEIASEIQKNLLPQGTPDISGYDIAALNIQSTAIGGDLYDFVALNETETGIAIGDVSGKGIPGALVMANLFATFREEVRQSTRPEEVIGQTNNALYHQTSADKFATFFYGILEKDNGSFRYTNGGHNPPLFISKEGSTKELTQGGMLLGFVHGVQYKFGELTLQPGDLLFLYTDGVTEAFDLNEAEFGDSRISDFLVKNRELTAKQILTGITEEIHQFTGKECHDDDITIIIVKKK